MFSKFSLKSKFTTISVVALLAVSFSAYEALHTFSEMTGLAEKVEIANQLLGNHMEGDMMHDGIRADVMKATVGIKTANAKLVQDAQADLKEHAGIFAEALAKNAALETPDEIKAAFQAVAPKIEAYKTAADRYIVEGLKDVQNGTSNADSQFHGFEEAFSVLEVDMGGLSDKITAYAATLKEEQVKEAETAKIKVSIAAVISFLLSLLIPIFSRFSMFNPLEKLVAANKNLAEGNINVNVPYAERTDEIGDLAKTLAVFKQGAIDKANLQEEQEQQKHIAEVDKKKAMADLANSFESQVGSIINGVTSASTELQATAEVMQGTASETSKQSGIVASASNEATSNVQTVASAAEELSASVREIQQRVSHSNTIVQEASQQANATNKRVQGLTEAASKIGAVVQLITDIASQTNLLALNATIEAARAGDAGKGFAVVASEVKNLAGQTAKATEEIAAQIKNIQEETRASAEAINNITKSIESINQTSSAIAAAVEQQGAATQEIAMNVSKAAQGTQEVSSNILRVSEAAQSTGTAATQVLSAAEELSKNGENLKTQVEAFLQRVRAS